MTSHPFFRPTVCRIDLDALESNVRTLRQLAGNRRFFAVVKSNAYGHGAVAISRKLESLGADALAVVSLEEALELRGSGIRVPILILGLLHPSSADIIARFGFIATVFTPTMANALQTACGAADTRLSIHIKMDTGMGRLGVKPNDSRPLFEALQNCPNLTVAGMFTHLAKADSDPDFTNAQIKTLESAAAKASRHATRGFVRHAANSAALLRYPQALLDAVRPGLALYGVSPFNQGQTTPPLKPVLSIATRILFIKEIVAGTPISYGGTFTTNRASRIATLPVGYADGLSRLRSNPSEGRGGAQGGFVLVKGRRCPIVGRVTMDLTMVDVTDVPGAEVDDEVVLLGSQGGEAITAADWAREMSTIPYEVLTGISGRIPRIVAGSRENQSGA